MTKSGRRFVRYQLDKVLIFLDYSQNSIQYDCLKFRQVQGKDPSVEVTQDIIEESEDERFDDISDHIPPIELPPCEIIHLEEIKEVIF